MPSDGQRFVTETGLGELLDRQLCGQVDERERVPVGGGDHLGGDQWIDRAGQRPGEQPARRLLWQAGQGHRGDTRRPARERRRRTGGEQQCHRFRRQATPHEGEDVEGLRVQQVRVVDRAHHRGRPARRAQQTQHAEADQVAVGCRAGDLTGGDEQGLPVPVGYGVEVSTQRSDEPLYGGEGHRDLGLEPVDFEQLSAGQVAGGGLEQGRLTDPRVPEEEQGATSAVPPVAEQRADSSQFRIATE